MAKTPNGLGQFSGKVGGVVFAVRNGQQVVRQYQPVVQNPKSAAQMAQRAKGNLVGRLSAVTPAEAILGLGANNAERRSRFLGLHLKAAKVALSEGAFVASIPFADLVFSEGSAPLLLRSMSASISTTTVTARFVRENFVSQDEWSRLGVRFVVVGLNSVTSSYDFVQWVDFNLPANVPGVSEGVSASIGLHLTAAQLEAYSLAGYFCSYLLDGTAGSSLSSFLGAEDDNVVANLALSAAAASARWANSYYVPVLAAA